MAIDLAGFKQARVLRLLGRHADGPASYRWVWRRLGFGRDILRATLKSENGLEFVQWFKAVGKQNLAEYLRKPA